MREPSEEENSRGLEVGASARHAIPQNTVILYPYTDTLPLGMFFKLNPVTGQPLFVQLMQQIRHAAETGVLRDGEQLPSVRALSQQLVVSPNTIVGRRIASWSMRVCSTCARVPVRS